MAAVVSSLLGLAESASETAEQDRLKNVTVENEGGLISCRRVGAEYVLSVLTSHETKHDALQSAVIHCAEKIGTALSNDAAA